MSEGKGDSLQESWVEITGVENGNGENGLHRVESMHNENSMQSLLMEAQKESREASRKGSNQSSLRNSPKQLTSPTGEMSGNGSNNKEVITASDFIWDWSSRIEPYPPKEYKYIHPAANTSGGSSQTGRSSSLSLRNTDFMKKATFSKDFLPLLIISNLVSLVVGAGIGVFIGKKLASASPPTPRGTLAAFYLN